jgi:ABC-type transport system involved in cytochrome bd biosynthesis fused ATPase/permease subunit
MSATSQPPGENADNSDLEILKFSRMETLIQNFGVKGIVPLSVVASVILAMVITFALKLIGLAILYSITVGITIAIAAPVSYFATRVAFRSLELKELALRYEQESKDAKESLEQIKRLIPWCPACNKVQTEQGDWRALALQYEHESEKMLKDVLCDPCLEEKYPQEFRIILESRKARLLTE